MFDGNRYKDEVTPQTEKNNTQKIKESPKTNISTTQSIITTNPLADLRGDKKDETFNCMYCNKDIQYYTWQNARTEAYKNYLTSSWYATYHDSECPRVKVHEKYKNLIPRIQIKNKCIEDKSYLCSLYTKIGDSCKNRILD